MQSRNAAWYNARVSLTSEVGIWRIRRAYRLAKHGHPHPDPKVDAQAVRWAKNVLSALPMYPELQNSKMLFLKVFMADGVIGDSFGNNKIALIDRVDRRRARVILDAHGIKLP